MNDWMATDNTTSRIGPEPHRTYDGNMTDDKTYVDSWCAIRRLRGDANFLLVGDSKLCTKENLQYIDSEGGRFLTVVPRSRREDDDFRAQLSQLPTVWQEILRGEADPGT